ncbi:MAG: ABC transporter permease [Chloroflexi bacterium]|nr:ABC transporter permease [Chloroflexota bacterium]
MAQAQALSAHPRLSVKLSDQASNVAWFLAPFLVLLVLWVVGIKVTQVPERVFPSVAQVWKAGVDMALDGTLLQHTWASLQRVLIGSAVAIAIGVPFGIAMGINRYVAGFFTPILRFTVALAGIAWIPIATLWFGYGDATVIFIIFNAVFFSLVYNTMLGVSRIPPELFRAAQSLGTGRLNIVWEVVIPGALPNIVTGLRVGLGFAWRGLFAAEMIATNVGLGYLLFLSRDFYETDRIILAMIVIGTLWLLMDYMILARLERTTIERWGMKKGAN